MLATVDFYDHTESQLTKDLVVREMILCLDFVEAYSELANRFCPL